ncbi:hypothetical protein D9757_015024 [Collybiopsis confluens]|uniref:Uncharacterized protein n=1 Tax=Collybiopsis confluens TaxID=2823264 RepID=A0A8H5CVU9_9AGAR|nr:hypothetical protein D9757_015024 [Collybiopsis confluens]
MIADTLDSDEFVSEPATGFTTVTVLSDLSFPIVSETATGFTFVTILSDLSFPTVSETATGFTAVSEPSTKSTTVSKPATESTTLSGIGNTTSSLAGASLSSASSTPTNSSISTIPSTPVPSPVNSSVNLAPTSTSDVKNKLRPMDYSFLCTFTYIPNFIRSISPVVPATGGSLVGVLVIVICGLLFYLRYRRRRRFQVTPLVNRDKENAGMSQPTRYLVQHEKQALSEALNESETTRSSSSRTPSPSTQIDHWHPNHLIPENIPTQGDDHAIRLQLQIAEMKVTVDRMMDRMMEQVQRIEARVGSSTNRERNLESISSSDGPPPTYVSS